LWLTSGRGRAEERLPEPVPLGYPARILLDDERGGGIVEGVFATVTGHVMTRQQRKEFQHRAYDWLDFYVDSHPARHLSKLCQRWRRVSAGRAAYRNGGF
jgi:hypothetical protein